MRTTVRLPDNLLLDAKRFAANSGSTLTALIERSLRETLARLRAPAPTRSPVRLTTCGGQGPRPGVDLDNSAALLDLMEETSDLQQRR